MANNIFSMPVGFRGVSSVWHNDTKIGICLTSNNSPLLYLSHRDEFLVTGINYSIADPEKIS